MGALCTKLSNVQGGASPPFAPSTVSSLSSGAQHSVLSLSGAWPVSCARAATVNAFFVLLAGVQQNLMDTLVCALTAEQRTYLQK